MSFSRTYGKVGLWNGYPIQPTARILVVPGPGGVSPAGVARWNRFSVNLSHCQGGA